MYVTCSAEHDRLPLPPAHEASIDQVWQSRVEGNPRLFNGTKFRMGSATCTDSQITLHLGLTDYKSHLGTNLADSWQLLRDAEPGDGRCLASPLGNGAVVETAD